MIIKTLVIGAIQENCYIVIDEETMEAVILDPGGNGPEISKVADDLGAKVKYVLLTHGHFDHVGAVEYLADKYKVPFYINEKDEDAIENDTTSVFGPLRKADGHLSEGDTISFGKTSAKVITTPGHTPGGVCFLIEDKLFTGDTLFQGAVGRTDFPGGNFEDLISGIKTKLLILDDGVEVYPGHGGSSTIGYEKMRNPFLD
ncbi:MULTISPECIES: MBL fold metallo-hydrolase [Clostridium]|uniref:MBL fold metallo-hydrolase n=1 Tax=Clostridium cibarium TaxID=2762247 RepID=A0ABR8PTJ9_9CLOT|nr:MULTISPECIES: MBL fold metallo-hydrolase [Clostridium]MBD7911505.1 MBL fold metallo-hydrolase [Clostridium cibarium]